jgi:hypothetical protein
MKLERERVKSVGLESTSGSRWCSSSFELGFRRSEGGWRRWTARAAEVRRELKLGEEKMLRLRAFGEVKQVTKQRLSLP